MTRARVRARLRALAGVLAALAALAACAWTVIGFWPDAGAWPFVVGVVVPGLSLASLSWGLRQLLRAVDPLAAQVRERRARNRRLARDGRGAQVLWSWFVALGWPVLAFGNLKDPHRTSMWLGLSVGAVLLYVWLAGQTTWRWRRRRRLALAAASADAGRWP